jgi:hypothetical protein
MGQIITMEADAGADMTSQGGEDTADLPLEQQADDAAALEGGNQSSAGPNYHDHHHRRRSNDRVEPSSAVHRVDGHGISILHCPHLDHHAPSA